MRWIFRILTLTRQLKAEAKHQYHINIWNGFCKALDCTFDELMTLIPDDKDKK